MGLLQSLSVLALRQVAEGAANAVGMTATKDKIIAFLGDHFADHSQPLMNALQNANDRAWKAFEVALAGESLWERCKVAVARAEDQAFRAQVRAFLDISPLTKASAEHAQLFKQALQELRSAQSRGALKTGSLAPSELAREAGALARFNDPQALIDAEWRLVDRAAGELREHCPNLWRLLVARPKAANKPSLLTVAVRYYFRREVESDQALAQGLSFAKLEALADAQEKGFASLSDALAQQGQRLEDLLGDVKAVVEQTHSAVLDVQGQIKGQGDQLREIGQAVQKLLDQHQLQRRELRPGDSLSIRNDDELQLVKRLVGRYRALPDEQRRQTPALLNALGKLQVVAGDFDAAQRDFQQVAALTTDKRIQAEAHFNAYQAASERQAWDEALAALRQAVALDPARFAPFPLHRYEPKRILGAGGFGTAVLCRDRHFDEDVVVKTLHGADLERGLDEVFREARVLHRLSHPAVIGVRDCDYADAARSRPFLVMDYFNGVNLDAYVTDQGILSPENLLPVAIAAAEALLAAHDSTILHRDVKPANLLVRRDGDRLQVKLIDFGLALRSDMLAGQTSTSGPQARTTVGKSIAGTRHYAAPEQMGELDAPVGPHSDVYGFGRTCYFALFETPDPDDEDKESLASSWRRFLSRCTAKKLSHRLQDFRAVLAELNALKTAMSVPKVQPAERAVDLQPLPANTADNQPDDRDPSKPRLFINAKGVVAEGQETKNGLLVLAGSQAVKEAVPSCQEYTVEMRNSLVQQGVLVVGPDCLTLARDYAFDSPSSAASVILGRNAGRSDWKDKEGQTLEQLQKGEHLGDEAEEEEAALQPPSDEKSWLEKHPEALECARWYKELLARFYGDVPIKFGRTMITLYLGGRVRVSVRPLKDRAVVQIACLEDVFAETVAFLNREKAAFTTESNKRIRFKVHLQQLKNHQGAHEWIAQRLAPEQLMTGRS